MRKWLNITFVVLFVTLVASMAWGQCPYPEPLGCPNSTINVDNNTMSGDLTIEGDVTVSPTLGSEIVVDGGFSSSANWDGDGAGGWASISGNADHDNDGTGTITPNVAIAATVGTQYLISYQLSSCNNDNIRVSYGGIDLHPADNDGFPKCVDGTYSDYITAVSTDGLTISPSLTTTRAVIDNVSIKAVTSAVDFSMPSSTLTVNQIALPIGFGGEAGGVNDSTAADRVLDAGEAADIDFWANTIRFGVSSNTAYRDRVDNVAKTTTWLNPHRDNQSPDVLILQSSATGGANIATWGGGDTNYVPMSRHRFSTGDDNTTAAAGDIRLYISNNVAIGDGLTFGTNAEGALGIVNATAVPTGVMANATQIYNADYASGDSRTYIMSEIDVSELILGKGQVISKPLDYSGTPQAGLAGGLKYFTYAISLTDDNEADSCTLGGTGVADCFVLPVATSSGRLIVYSEEAVYGQYLIGADGTATPVPGITETNTAYTAAIANCANAVVCLFDDATTANALGIINQLGATKTVQVQFWYD